MAEPDPAAPQPGGDAAPDWLGRLAHDLRNPITPMRSAVQLLQLGQLPPELAPDLLRTLDRQIDYLLRVIDDVSDLVKIDRGRFTLQLADCELDSVVASAAARHARAGGKGGKPAATPEVLAAAEPLWVRADEVRLRQLVGHLLEYLDDAGGEVAPATVELARGDGNAIVRFRAGGRPLGPDARLEFLGGGPPPTDRASLTLSHLVLRRVAELHGAALAVAPDAAAIELRVPLATLA
jgi:nitrogen fixation/metabolism regulation signal transduction histidine kinase